MAKLKDLAIKGAGDRLLFDLGMVYEKPGYNLRDMNSAETQAHIRKMADAIKENGTDAFPEITVFQEDDKVYVHRGHCRLRAHKLAQAEGAPVVGIRVIAAPKQNDAEHTLDMLNSNDGLHLSPMEQAKGVHQLVVKFEWPPEMVAKKRGCSVTAIRDLLKLMEAPEEVKEMVRSGEVSARMATDVIRKEGADKAPETLQKALEAAKEKGKGRATPKHLPKKPEPLEKETPAPTPDAATKTAPAPAGNKDAGKVTPLPKPGVNYEKHGPTMLKFMKAIRDVPNMARLQELQSQAGALIKGFEK